MKVAKWFAMFFLVSVTSGALATQLPMLDDQPWPSRDGKLLSGHVKLLLVVAWDGTPLQGCILRSSGDGTLDNAALRRAARLQLPDTEPMPSIHAVRLPLDFTPPASPDVIELAEADEKDCTPENLPSYEPAMGRRAQELAHVIDVTMTADGYLPGTRSPWPRDERGKPLSGSVTIGGDVEHGRLAETALVDLGGPPTRVPAFMAYAALHTRGMAMDFPNDRPHTGVLEMKFGIAPEQRNKLLPPLVKGSPEWQQAGKESACGLMADLAFFMSREQRAGARQDEALAKALQMTNGQLSDSLTTLAKTVYAVHDPYRGPLSDQFNRTNGLLLCLKTLPASGAR